MGINHHNDPEAASQIEKLRKEGESDSEESAYQPGQVRDLLDFFKPKSKLDIVIYAASAAAGITHSYCDMNGIPLQHSVPIFGDLESLLIWGPSLASGLAGAIMGTKNNNESYVIFIPEVSPLEIPTKFAIIGGAFIDGLSAAFKSGVANLGGYAVPYIARGLNYIKG
ncbi:hypothetical protein HYX05_03505 [Candidatus Woesearchaeota archaeon]|nr:hypothetical protein [Candidatus Woesearchaeota archaeon]